MKRLHLLLVSLCILFPIRGADCENVFLITLDGLRWQELFSGAEEALISKAAGVHDPNRLRAQFWRDTPEERRRALLPFFWNVIAHQGQLWGNQTLGSVVRVTNGKNFTYPGFNEILTGFADPGITSNAKIANTNVTVLEWLHRKERFKGRVAAFANWDVFPFIMNAARADIPIWTSYPEGTLPDVNPALARVSEMARKITPVWDGIGMNFDVFFAEAAREYIQVKKPRVVWIAFSETDEWAHEGRYDLYLHAANKIDGYIRDLWHTVQAMEEYKNKTAFLITTDHGRGTGLSDWKNHGADIQGADGIWLAALGPGIPASGEKKNVPTLGQNQIAATLATLLGEIYEVPGAGAAIPLQ